MNGWKDWLLNPPAEGKLVLVEFAYGYGLRSLDDDGILWDENEIFDDSGEEPQRWLEIPE